MASNLSRPSAFFFIHVLQHTSSFFYRRMSDQGTGVAPTIIKILHAQKRHIPVGYRAIFVPSIRDENAAFVMIHWCNCSV